MNEKSRKYGAVLFGYLTFGCVDEPGDEVAADDEADGSSSTTSIEDESTEQGSETLDTESDSSESDSSDSSDSSESESSTESTEETTESSSEEESGMMDTDTGGNLECGDGMLQIQEACDDGNDLDGDGCEADCTFTIHVDWMAVRDPMNATPCSSIHRMAFRADGDVATVGVSKLTQSSGPLFVANWDAGNGDILVEYIGGSSLHQETKAPNLDPLPDGDLLVSRSVDGGMNDFATVWRFGSDLAIEWSLGVDELGIDDMPEHYADVLARPGGGLILLGQGYYKRIHEIDAQGQLLDTVEFGNYFSGFDLEWVDNDVWFLGRFQQVNPTNYLARVGRFVVPGLAQIGLYTSWQLSTWDHRPVELEHRGVHTVGLSPTTHPDMPQPGHGMVTLWRFDEFGEIADTQTFPEFGSVRPEGLAVTDDGTAIVATRTEVFAVDLDGKVLWYVDADEIDPDISFSDALVDDQGQIYVGGQVFVDWDCDEAALVRLSL